MRKAGRTVAATAVLVLLAGCGGHNPPAPRTAVVVFRLHDGVLHAERAEVPAEPSTPAAALGALGLDVPVTVDGGTAHVQSGHLSAGRVAEVVYTLTQFASVRRVDVAGRTNLVRRDMTAFLPAILVESPADGARVPASFVVSGSASVFEATLVVELRRDGRRLLRRTVTASEGAPGRGRFRTTLRAPGAGPAEVVAYAPSAADGSPQHVQHVPISVR